MKYTIVLQNRQVAENASLKQLCTKLVQWITTNENVTKILIPYILHETYVSKRLIYWTVSKYAQDHAISIIQPKHITHVYEQYTNNLRMYNRKLFDVFCRQPFLLEFEMQVSFETWKAVYELKNSNNETLSDIAQERIYAFKNASCCVCTTLGQLNFFHWASINGILSYIKTYKDKLLVLMKSDSRKRRLEQKETKKDGRQSKRTKIVKHPIVILHRPCLLEV